MYCKALTSDSLSTHGFLGAKPPIIPSSTSLLQSPRHRGTRRSRRSRPRHTRNSPARRSRSRSRSLLTGAPRPSPCSTACGLCWWWLRCHPASAAASTDELTSMVVGAALCGARAAPANLPSLLTLLLALAATHRRCWPAAAGCAAGTRARIVAAARQPRAPLCRQRGLEEPLEPTRGLTHHVKSGLFFAPVFYDTLRYAKKSL